MPLSFNDIFLGLLIPALAALLLTLGASRLAKGACLPWIMPLALAAGFLAGYWLLKLGPIVPKFDRTWLPYAVLLSLAPAMLPGRRWPTFVLKAVVAGTVCLVAAWLLVPNWEPLKDLRAVYVVLWGLYAASVSIALMLVARRDQWLSEPIAGDHAADVAAEGNNSRQLLFILLMTLALAFSFVLLALSGSLRFAQTAAAGMAALGGIGVALWLSKSRPPLDSLAIVYSMPITGVLLTGLVNSFSGIPLISYLLLPWVPLAQGATLHSRSGKPLSLRQMVLIIGIAAAICIVALLLAVRGQPE